MRRLYRSETDQMLGGVCAGIAELMNIDPTIVRLVVAFCTVLTGILPGVVAYVLAWMIVPPKSQLPMP